MEKMSVGEIVRAIKGRLRGKAENEVIRGISTDTRTLKKGDLFFALKGNNFDGHNFIGEAIRKGARGIVCQRQKFSRKERKTVFIEVHNTLDALGDLASFYRQKFSLTVIAVSGSNGKTTTKEMIAAMLSQKSAVLKSEKNYNNEIGLSLSLLRLNKRHRFAVLELGINARGEMQRLVKMCQPDIGLLTNINAVHCAGLGTVEEIAGEKFVLIDGLQKNGRAILNLDDPLIAGRIPYLKVACQTYGIKKRGDYYLSRIEDKGIQGLEFCLHVKNSKFKYQGLAPIPGRFNLYNALAAAACVHSLTGDIGLVKKGLEEFIPLSRRMQIKKHRGRTIIDDSYNANPASVKEAIIFLASFCARKIFVFGDMLELGSMAKAAHEEIGRLVAENKIDFLFTFGKFARLSARQAIREGISPGGVYICDNKKRLIQELSGLVKKADVVLVKGSRMMKMEEVADALLAL